MTLDTSGDEDDLGEAGDRDRPVIRRSERVTTRAWRYDSLEYDHV